MKDTMSVNEQEASSNGIVKDQQQTAQMETGELGEAGNNVEAMGLENVESYDFEFPLGEGFIKGGEEFEAASQTTDEHTQKEAKEVEIKDEENLMDAYHGSYTMTKAELKESQMSIESVIGTDDRVRINNTTTYPWRAICSLLITAQSGKRFIGTGWFISPRTVVTAGHVVYMHNEGGWAKSIEVMPGRNGSSLPYGSATSSNLRSVMGWTKSKNADLDYGAIILPAAKRLGSLTGWFGFANLNDNDLKNKYVNLSGYPGDKPSGTHWYNSRKVHHVSARKVHYEIDTYGGQSGSPVWYIADGKRFAVGVHTYGTGGGSTNSATRIVKNVYDNLLSWKNQGA